MPGGRVYFREKIESAAERIIQQELGTELENLSERMRLIGYVEVPRDGNYHSISNVFVLVISKEEMAKISLGKQATRFKLFSEAPSNTHLPQKKFLEKNSAI